MTVSARRDHLRPTRGEGSGDLLRSVPDSILRTLGGSHIEREVSSTGWGDDDDETPSKTEKVFVSPDMVHHEMKWRGLL